MWRYPEGEAELRWGRSQESSSVATLGVEETEPKEPSQKGEAEKLDAIAAGALPTPTHSTSQLAS